MGGMAMHARMKWRGGAPLVLLVGGWGVLIHSTLSTCIIVTRLAALLQLCALLSAALLTHSCLLACAMGSNSPAVLGEAACGSVWQL